MRKIIKYASASTTVYFDSSLMELENLFDKKSTFIITDDNLFHFYQKRLKGWNTLLISAGEQHKNQATVDELILKLIEAGADRKSTIIGFGGGVVTDIAGFTASIYMRGVDFGFIPTSILAMIDASIGGKNGIDVGVYKNMAGVIRQPKFLLYDYSVLKTLPQEHWINGFAEVIKHAAIKDAVMFRQLETHTLRDFRKNKDLLGKLIERNVLLKAKVVQHDEFEQGDRKLLNFGHTLGHAIENKYQLLHGQAVAVGMTAAAYLSKALLGFPSSEKLVNMLESYGLPAFYNFDVDDALQKMLADKKRVRDTINYILLSKIGEAVYKPLTIEAVRPMLEAVAKK